jgi:hypothetical protein
LNNLKLVKSPAILSVFHDVVISHCFLSALFSKKCCTNSETGYIPHRVRVDNRFDEEGYEPKNRLGSRHQGQIEEMGMGSIKRVSGSLAGIFCSVLALSRCVLPIKHRFASNAHAALLTVAVAILGASQANAQVCAVPGKDGPVTPVAATLRLRSVRSALEPTRMALLLRQQRLPSATCC